MNRTMVKLFEGAWREIEHEIETHAQTGWYVREMHPSSTITETVHSTGSHDQLASVVGWVVVFEWWAEGTRP